MKKITWTVFVMFWVATATLLAVGALTNEPVAAGATPPRIITLEELARHNSAESCWKAIHGKVYDFTDYLPRHPTPPIVMLQWCGKETTEAYDTKGYGRPHSPAADAMLESYYIGELATDAD